MIFPASPPTGVVKCRPAFVSYIADRLREDERRQYEAVACCAYEPDRLVEDVVTKPGFKVCVTLPNGEPGVAGGFEPVIEGVYQAWMIGTYNGWAHWRLVTKAVRWLMGVTIREGRARRIQTSCTSDRTAAVEWFARSLGMEHEGTDTAFGFHGEDFERFALVIKENCHVKESPGIQQSGEQDCSPAGREQKDRGEGARGLDASGERERAAEESAA